MEPRRFRLLGRIHGIGGRCAPLTIQYKKLSFLRFADVAGIAIAAGYAVGRTGCWAVGDDYGKPYTGPLAVAFPQGAPPSTVGGDAEHVSRHRFRPAPIRTTSCRSIRRSCSRSRWGLIMFGILWRMRDHKHAEGWLFGVWCVLAGIERFIVEFFRAKDDRFSWTIRAEHGAGHRARDGRVGFAIMAARRNPGPDRPGIHAHGRRRNALSSLPALIQRASGPPTASRVAAIDTAAQHLGLFDRDERVPVVLV